MDAKEVIERLCLLQRKVGEHIGLEHASDCFCKQSGFWGAESYGGTFEEGYRNDGVALAFIEDAVREKIERDTANARGKRRKDRTAGFASA